MARKKQSYIKGTFTHRRTEADYMGVLLDAVPLEEWREIVSATVAAAKAGDATARAWLAQYLVGKPAATAPAPLTVIVQQLSGRDPLAERLAPPHINRRACRDSRCPLNARSHGRSSLLGSDFRY